MADDTGMFSLASPTSEAPAAMRMKLKNYDLVAAQALNSMGVSRIESITLEALRDVVMAGNKATRYFSEFADADPSRRGVAISRLAQVMLLFIERMESDIASKVLNKTVRDKAMAEAAKLKPHFATLDGGMNATTESKTLKWAPVSGKPKNQDDISAAADAVYD